MIQFCVIESDRTTQQAPQQYNERRESHGLIVNFLDLVGVRDLTKRGRTIPFSNSVELTAVQFTLKGSFQLFCGCI